MNLQVTEPILVIGLGGAGSRLAVKAKEVLNSECLIISNDKKDFQEGSGFIKISTDSIINPSVQLIRGSTYKNLAQIRSEIANFATVILITNLAGKGGSAISPVISEICKEAKKNTISFAIMPFKFEKDRIFNSGISLKRVNANSNCTIVLDNDALLESNPDLSPSACYKIANDAIIHIVSSLGSSDITAKTNILTSSKNDKSLEESLRDSLKMLYNNTPVNAVKHSIIHIVGGENIPLGIINSIANLSKGASENNAQINLISSEESKVIMLSSIQGMTKFEKYDPLGMIPIENSLDWEVPDCSIDCKLDLYQLE